jgi:hypothetical protein
MAYSLMSYVFGGLWVGLPPVAFVLVVWRWMRSSPKIAEPAWRGYFALAAASLAGISVILWVTSIVWAQKIGGFGYFDPVLLRFYRWGALTGLAGLVAGFGGTGKLRWPSCALATIMTLLWLMAATGE